MFFKNFPTHFPGSWTKAVKSLLRPWNKEEPGQALTSSGCFESAVDTRFVYLYTVYAIMSVIQIYLTVCLLHLCISQLLHHSWFQWNNDKSFQWKSRLQSVTVLHWQNIRVIMNCWTLIKCYRLRFDLLRCPEANTEHWRSLINSSRWQHCSIWLSEGLKKAVM